MEGKNDRTNQRTRVRKQSWNERKGGQRKEGREGLPSISPSFLKEGRKEGRKER
jgi:hypothetical protein